MAKESEVKLDEKKNSQQLEWDKGIAYWDTEEVVHNLKRIQREAKNATQAIKGLELAQSISKHQTEVDTLLNLASKYGFLLTATTHDKSRGIGKTHALVKKAMAENLVILVSNMHEVDYMYNNFNFKNALSIRHITGGLTMIDESQGFVVDDMVPIEYVEKLMTLYPYLELKGGFVSDSTTVKLGNLQLEKEY